MDTTDTTSNGLLDLAAKQMAQLDLVGKNLSNSSGNIAGSPANKPRSNGNVKESTTSVGGRKTPAKRDSSLPSSGRTSRKPSSNTVKTPDQSKPDEPLIKKIPMNKIKVGSAAASPNIKEVKSKINSLEKTSYQPSGGNIKIESKKLAWKAESKIGSLSNVKYSPTGGNVKIETKKIDLKNVQSRVGSLGNVTHKAGGGNKKIFDDKSFMRTTGSKTPSETISPKGAMSPVPQSPQPQAINNNGNLI